jgi:putative flippase GtrA
MPLRDFLQLRYVAIGGLALVLSAIVSWAFVIPSASGKFIGVCLIGIGFLYVAMYRMSGQWAFRQGQGLPLVSGVWRSLGKEGAQALYLGIGVALVAVGFGLLTTALLSR